jgi:hypothetical protein
MATEQDVIRKLQIFQQRAKHAGKIKAEIFPVPQELDDGTVVTDVRDRQRPGYSMVRLDNDVPQSLTADARSFVSVRNLNAANYKAGVFVYIERDVDGEWHVPHQDEAANLDSHGEAAATLGLPALHGELLKLVLESRNFKPNRVRPDASGGLNIYIEEGIYSYADTYFAWDDPTPYDLSTISVSSGKQKPVIIGLNPATNSIITAEGSEKTLAEPISKADFITVMNTVPGKIWLAGYARIHGVTAFRTEFDLVDIRAWLSPGQGVSSGSGGMPIELNYELTIPANYQHVVDYMVTADGGSLINYGIVRTA